MVYARKGGTARNGNYLPFDFEAVRIQLISGVRIVKNIKSTIALLLKGQTKKIIRNKDFTTFEFFRHYVGILHSKQAGPFSYYSLTGG